MRMQKTDMEFVQFDAKDVIQTSWGGFGMYASNALIKEYNDQYSGRRLQDNGELTGAGGFRYSCDTTKNDGSYSWTRPISMGNSSWNEEIKEDTYGGQTYKKATSVQDIVDWLNANGIQ